MVRTELKNKGPLECVERRPLVVEVVGLAGAGKTTLVRALSQRDKKILPGTYIPKTKFILCLINNMLVLLPIFLRHYPQKSRWFTWDETRSMVYVRGWHQILTRHATVTDSVTILDHGPIFRLARLHGFGPEITRSQTYIKWWERMLTKWAATLDLVIWLDAPDVILLDRINSRDEKHLVKGRSEQEGFEFLARFRTSYELVIATMTAIGGPRLLRVDTHQESVNQIADRVITALQLQP